MISENPPPPETRCGVPTCSHANCQRWPPVKRHTKIHHVTNNRVEQLQNGVDAIFSNLMYWPGTMTRERLLNDLHALQQGYYLETLT